MAGLKSGFRIPGFGPENRRIRIPDTRFVVTWPQRPGFPKRGLTGLVMTGEDENGNPIVAKLFDPDALPPEDIQYLRHQFLMEAPISQRLGGEYVIRTLGFNKAPVDPWPPVIIMEFADASIQDLLEECQKEELQLSLKVVWRIAWGTARGMKTFHDSGLVHRDIKPGNLGIRMGHLYRYINVTQLDQQQFTAAIMDPGFAIQVRKRQQRGFDQDGFKGPEQLRDQAVSDRRSDFVGFGRTLEKLLKECHVADSEYRPVRDRLVQLAETCAKSKTEHRPRDAREIVRRLSEIGKELRRLCRRK